MRISALYSRTIIALVWALLLGGSSGACGADPPRAGASRYPWTQAQTVDAAAFAREIAAARGPDRPLVAYTGPPFLYGVGRIPGAVMLGVAASPAGVRALQAWAEPLPRTSNIVVYCGCCPLDDCPNLIPAFSRLRDMGFTRVRVLILPRSFGADWASPGYPVER